jgi:hypothetical protein
MWFVWALLERISWGESAVSLDVEEKCDTGKGGGVVKQFWHIKLLGAGLSVSPLLSMQGLMFQVS